MKFRYSVLVGLLVLGFLIGSVHAVPSIDGSLADWGLGKLVTDPWSAEGTWVPSAGISFVVEDNNNPALSASPYPFTGVHIKGTGSFYSFYNEPKVQDIHGNWVLEPVGGEGFDLEATYLSQDASNLYLGIVTSVNPAETGGLRPGDLALNIDGDPTTGENGYEYGIVFGEHPYLGSGLVQGDIVYLPDWESTGAVLPLDRPDVIKGFQAGGGIVGNLGSDLAYDNSWMTVLDHSKPNYVIEAAIPKALIGATGKTLSISNLFYADNCLNDTLYVPEFPTIAISIGAILGIMFIVVYRQNKN
jgi:hypothetical protein